MKFERLIARRFLQKGEGNFTRPLVNIATYSIALGVLVIIMSVSILRGFQNEITQKVVGFGSHIVVKTFESQNNFYEHLPVTADRQLVSRIGDIKGVKHVQLFAQKGGMVKTDDQIHGIIFKGVDRNFDSTFFKINLKEGSLFSFPADRASNEIIVSQRFSDKMRLKIGDKVRTYFWAGDNYRPRAFSIVGIYSTDLTEFDEKFIVGDMRHIQKINGWDSSQVAGYEILVNNFDNLDQIAGNVYDQIGNSLTVSTIVENNPDMFSWLSLLDTDIVLILAVMILVCIVSVISALLIMIFEKTPMIGLLKTMGATNASIRKIFLYKSAGIITKGLIAGNAIALLACELQDKFHIVKLDSDSYHMAAVPIDLNPWIFVILSAGTATVCLLALIIPSSCVAGILPAKAIKVE